MKLQCCNQILPSDVMQDIFVNLPVKSLVRFSCLSKSCLCHIKCPEFAIRHFLTKSNTSSPCIIDYVPTMNSSKQITLKINISSLTKTKTLHLETKFEVGNATTVLVSNYCHGVTCIYIANKSDEKKLVLFNPAIREVVEVPLCSRISVHGSIRFGIGFDSKLNDYRIMMVAEDKPFPGVEVYSVRNGKWRYISSEGYSISKDFGPVLNANGRILNLMGYNRQSMTRGVLSFDVVDEIFWLTNLPECSCPSCLNHCLLPSSYWQAVICYSSPGLEGNSAIDIWVLEERIILCDDHHEAIWSKLASIAIPVERYLISSVEVWMNDKEVMLQLKKKEGTQINSAEMFVYSLVNQELKLIEELKPLGEGSFYIADVYMESLISIKSLISSHKEEALANDIGKNKGSLCFIREILGGNDVGWCHEFKLDKYL